MANVNSLKRGSISATMDPLLFEGGHTVQEIAAAVAQALGDVVAGKNLVNHVRVRISVLAKRGFVVNKNEVGMVQLSK